MIQLKSLHIYPVKSCQGISLPELEVSAQGARWDRQWMLVDEGGQFVTQRQIPRMAQIETTLNSEELVLRFANQSIEISLQSEPLRELPVQIWKSSVTALLEEDFVNHKISEFLERQVLLVRWGTKTQRAAKFTDSGPLLLVNQKSLENLNQKLPKPVGMERFRANLVVSGEEAFAEDRWTSLKTAQGLELALVKGCSRCVIINQDQKTGDAVAGAEPLAALARYRRVDGRVLFGVYLAPQKQAWLRLGDQLGYDEYPRF